MALTDSMYPGRFVGAERILLSGNFDDALAVEGCPGLTVSDDTGGVYTLTLPGKGTVDVMSAVFTCESADTVQITARDDTARTIEITLSGAAALASGEKVHFMIVVKNSDLLNA